MSCNCGCGGSQLRHYTLLSARDLACSPGQRLIGVVDRARDIVAQLGLRPYVVSIVRRQWSGPRRGVGVEDDAVSVLRILPVPVVMDLSGVAQVASPGGLDEQGGVLVKQVSGRYSEDVLLCRDRDGEPADANASVHWEISFTDPTGRPSEARRFTPASAPYYDPEKFEWSIRLERASGADRPRGGGP